MGVHVSKIPKGAPQWLIKLDQDLHVAKCTRVAALSIALYDWFACLEDEIELIWKTSHSVFKYLALFCRYQAIICSLGIVILTLGDWTKEQCGKFRILAAITTDFSGLSVVYVLGLRTAALYSFETRIASLIGTALLAQTALALWASTDWTVINIPPEISGCFVRPGLGSRLGVALYWFPAATIDLLLLILTVGRVFPIWSGATHSRLSFVVLRDQIFYYSIISMLTLSLCVLHLLGQNAIASALIPLALTLRPTLIFHLVLNLRSVDRSSLDSEDEGPIPMAQILAATVQLRPRSETIGATGRDRGDGGAGVRARTARIGRNGNEAEVREGDREESSHPVIDPLSIINREAED